MIYFFINIINVIIWIPLIISQKCVVFALISIKFSVLSSKFFCLPLFLVWILIRATTLFATNITLSSPWFMTIVVVIRAIVGIVAFVVLITVIIPPKSTICKVLSIGNIAIIMCYDRWLKLGRKFFKGCYKSKQRKFQLINSAISPLNSGNKLVFAHITKS